MAELHPSSSHSWHWKYANKLADFGYTSSFLVRASMVEPEEIQGALENCASPRSNRTRCSQRLLFSRSRRFNSSSEAVCNDIGIVTTLALPRKARIHRVVGQCASYLLAPNSHTCSFNWQTQIEFLCANDISVNSIAPNKHKYNHKWS